MSQNYQLAAIIDDKVFVWGVPDKGRLGLPKNYEDAASLIGEPLDLTANGQFEEEVQQVRTLDKPLIRDDIFKSKLLEVSSLQLTLKNLPKSMDIGLIYADDLNIAIYFDKVSTKNLPEWRLVRGKNFKYKVILKAFLQFLFKKNKER